MSEEHDVDVFGRHAFRAHIFQESAPSAAEEVDRPWPHAGIAQDGLAMRADGVARSHGAEPLLAEGLGIEIAVALEGCLALLGEEHRPRELHGHVDQRDDLNVSDCDLGRGHTWAPSGLGSAFATSNTRLGEPLSMSV